VGDDVVSVEAAHLPPVTLNYSTPLTQTLKKPIKGVIGGKYNLQKETYRKKTSAEARKRRIGRTLLERRVRLSQSRRLT